MIPKKLRILRKFLSPKGKQLTTKAKEKRLKKSTIQLRNKKQNCTNKN